MSEKVKSFDNKMWKIIIKYWYIDCVYIKIFFVEKFAIKNFRSKVKEKWENVVNLCKIYKEYIKITYILTRKTNITGKRAKMWEEN